MADDVTIERIDNLRSVGRRSDAEQALRTALSDEPQDGALLWRLAAVLLAGDRLAEGLTVAHAAVAAAPENPNAHRVYALLLSEAGHHREALAAGYAAVTLMPEHPHTVVVYSYVLGRAQCHREAADVARRAVELAPHDTETHAQVGDVALAMGDRATARMAYQHVLRLEPDNAAAQRSIAALDHLERRPRKALHGLVSAGRIDPNLTQVLSLVASVLWQLSWRLRVGLVLALVPVMVVAASEDFHSSWAVRIVGAAILGLTAFAVWWHVRDLPQGTGPVLRAALRQDTLLAVTYGFIAMCLLVYVAVTVTGSGSLAAIIWPVAILLSVVAVISRIVRR